MGGALGRHIACVAVLATACSAYDSVDGTDAGVLAGDDASPPFAAEAGPTGPPADGGGDGSGQPEDAALDGGADAGVLELLSNGGFETGSCAPMEHNASKTSTEASATARSGAWSCRVCNTGAPSGTYGLFQSFPDGHYGAGTYTIHAYVRYDGDGGSSLGIAQLTVKSTVGAPARYPGKNAATSASAWTHLEISADVAPDEFLSGFTVGGYSEVVGPCVLLDDITIVRQ